MKFDDHMGVTESVSLYTVFNHDYPTTMTFYRLTLKSIRHLLDSSQTEYEVS